MLTYLTPADDTEVAVAEDEWAERRQALCIRPLLEHAGLRQTLGLAPIAPSAMTKTGKRIPATSSAPASNRRTKNASKKNAAHAARASR